MKGRAPIVFGIVGHESNHEYFARDLSTAEVICGKDATELTDSPIVLCIDDGNHSNRTMRPVYHQDETCILYMHGSAVIEEAKVTKDAGRELTRWCSKNASILLSINDRTAIGRVLNQLSGRFVFLFWNKAHKSLHIARDRLGKTTLYYGWINDTFVFSTKLEVFRKYPGFTAKINRGAIALLLRHNCTPSPHTIYEGVYKLPPGTFLTVHADSLGDRPSPPSSAPLSIIFLVFNGIPPFRIYLFV